MKVTRIDVNGRWVVYLLDRTKWELRQSTVQAMTSEGYTALLDFLEKLTKTRDVSHDELKANGFKEVS